MSGRSIDGWTPTDIDDASAWRMLDHLKAAGALAGAERVLDAIDAGEDLGPIHTIDEFLARIDTPNPNPEGDPQ